MSGAKSLERGKQHSGPSGKAGRVSRPASNTVYRKESGVGWSDTRHEETNKVALRSAAGPRGAVGRDSDKVHNQQVGNNCERGASQSD